MARAREMWSSALGRIPESEDLLAAKKELRDRLFAPVAKASDKVWAARKEGFFQPEPALNLVGVGIGEVVIEGVGGAFSRSGDSGSAIVDPLGRVVALLFAGSPKVTFAIPIRRILNRFKIRIATP